MNSAIIATLTAAGLGCLSVVEPHGENKSDSAHQGRAQGLNGFIKYPPKIIRSLAVFTTWN